MGLFKGGKKPPERRQKRRSLRVFRRDRRLDRWFYGVALALAAVLYFYHVPSRKSDLSPASQDYWLVGTSSGTFCSDPAALVRASVRETVDGDTLRVMWEGRPRFLRYYGVDTPERDEPCYREATERNRQLAGNTVLLGFDGRREDSHGRLLAYVFTEDGLFIDAQLVAEGWGRAWRRDGRFHEYVARLEENARAAGTGCLWERTGKR